MNMYNYETKAAKLEQQFGTGKIVLLDGKESKGVSPTATLSSDDPHGWCAAFEAAAAR